MFNLPDSELEEITRKRDELVDNIRLRENILDGLPKDLREPIWKIICRIDDIKQRMVVKHL